MGYPFSAFKEKHFAMTREEFCHGIENWDNYKPLLWEGLQLSQGDIIEMGVGKGSTQLLHDYAIEKRRMLYSFDSNPLWIEKFMMLESEFHFLDHCQIHCNGYAESNWDYPHNLVTSDIGLVFIDHAPGERRKIDIALFANKAQIIVAHDTEPSADYGYGMRAAIVKFKYWRDFETLGAWTSIMSNFIDVTKPL